MTAWVGKERSFELRPFIDRLAKLLKSAPPTVDEGPTEVAAAKLSRIEVGQAVEGGGDQACGDACDRSGPGLAPGFEDQHRAQEAQRETGDLEGRWAAAGEQDGCLARGG